MIVWTKWSEKFSRSEHYVALLARLYRVLEYLSCGVYLKPKFRIWSGIKSEFLICPGRYWQKPWICCREVIANTNKRCQGGSVRQDSEWYPRTSKIHTDSHFSRALGTYITQLGHILSRDGQPWNMNTHMGPHSLTTSNCSNPSDNTKGTKTTTSALTRQSIQQNCPNHHCQRQRDIDIMPCFIYVSRTTFSGTTYPIN